MCILTDIADAVRDLPLGAQVELVTGHSVYHAWHARAHIALDDDRLAIVYGWVRHLKPVMTGEYQGWHLRSISPWLPGPSTDRRAA